MERGTWGEVMQIKLQIVKAFVDNDKGGNPAGVVMDADELSYDQKLSIAKQAGFSETAFISRSLIADFKFDFFTPTKQIAHCGHATIGAFSYLKQTGRIAGTDSSKETIDGIRKIKLVGDLAFMEQTAPSYIDVSTEADLILQSLHIVHEDLYPDLAPIIVNTGNAFLIIPLKNRQVLQSLQPDLEKVAAYSKPYNLIGFYPFTLETEKAGRDAGTRYVWSLLRYTGRIWYWHGRRSAGLLFV